MQKIVIIGSNSIHLKRYLSALVASNQYDVHIISNKYFDEFDACPQLVCKFAFINLGTAAQIRRYLQQIKPAIVHIHQANSYAWHAMRALSNWPQRPQVVLTTWGSDVLVLPKQNRIFKSMVQSNLRAADMITADSLYMAMQINELLAGVTRPLQVINFGIKDLPPQMQATSRPKIILSNRLHKPLYRVEHIITAFATLLQKGLIDPDYHLVVAASGEETNRLQQIASKCQLTSQQVTFTGMLDYARLVDYYQQARVFVSVPTSDGTASSLLEAMAYGCIPVLSNLPANLEWVIDQINGFIAADISLLDKQILAAIKLSENEERYQQLIRFNYELIKQKALFSSNFQSFLHLYKCAKSCLPN